MCSYGRKPVSTVKELSMLQLVIIDRSGKKLRCEKKKIAWDILIASLQSRTVSCQFESRTAANLFKGRTVIA